MRANYTDDDYSKACLMSGKTKQQLRSRMKNHNLTLWQAVDYKPQLKSANYSSLDGNERAAPKFSQKLARKFHSLKLRGFYAHECTQ